jgi:lipoprotein-anchoring transpeptidase ErfK/SrfK
VARRIALAFVLAAVACLVGHFALRGPDAATASAPKIGIPVAKIGKPVVHKVVRRVKRAKPNTVIAHVRSGRSIPVRSAPNGPVVARISSRTEFGSPQTFAVTRALRGRLAVITTALPNGRLGWVSPRALRLSRTYVSLDVDLSSRLLRVHSGGRVVRRIRIGIGAPGTPTPIGRFAITDKLRGSDYSPAYGCCILALSGHQTNLPPGWTGGNRLAIHEGSTAGAVSTGCLHARPEDLTYLMRSVPLGARVVIHP